MNAKLFSMTGLVATMAFATAAFTNPITLPAEPPPTPHNLPRFPAEQLELRDGLWFRQEAFIPSCMTNPDSFDCYVDRGRVYTNPEAEDYRAYLTSAAVAPPRKDDRWSAGFIFAAVLSGTITLAAASSIPVMLKARRRRGLRPLLRRAQAELQLHQRRRREGNRFSVPTRDDSAALYGLIDALAVTHVDSYENITLGTFNLGNVPFTKACSVAVHDRPAGLYRLYIAAPGKKLPHDGREARVYTATISEDVYARYLKADDAQRARMRRRWGGMVHEADFIDVRHTQMKRVALGRYLLAQGLRPERSAAERWVISAVANSLFEKKFLPRPAFRHTFRNQLAHLGRVARQQWWGDDMRMLQAGAEAAEAQALADAAPMPCNVLRAQPLAAAGAHPLAA